MVLHGVEVGSQIGNGHSERVGERGRSPREPTLVAFRTRVAA